MGDEEKENHERIDKLFFSVTFPDGSVFNLPREWEDVFVDYYGQNPETYPQVTERLRFVVGKYIEHRAWPTKFDGLQFTGEEEEELGDEKYNDPEYYWKHWENWGEAGMEWGDRGSRRIIKEPTQADVAEAVIYYSIRGGLLQKALQQMGAKTRVITPRRFLKELEDQQKIQE